MAANLALIRRRDSPPKVSNAPGRRSSRWLEVTIPLGLFPPERDLIRSRRYAIRASENPNGIPSQSPATVRHELPWITVRKKLPTATPLTSNSSSIHSPHQMQLDWSTTSLRLLLGFPSSQLLFVAAEFATLTTTTKCTPVKKTTTVFGMQAEMT